MNLFRSFARLMLSIAAACAAAISAHAFDGKIDMKMTVSGKAMDTVYRTKGSRVRMDFTMPEGKKGGGGGGAIISDLDKKESLILMMEQKMYMVQKMPEASSKTSGGPAGNMPQADFKPTGRKEKIAGILAEEYVSKTDGKITEIWVTKELGKFVPAGGGGRGPMGGGGRPPAGGSGSAWEKFASQGDFFPLRTVVKKSESGPEEMRMEVTKVEKGSQPDSLFVPPADFQKFEMPNMGDMMRGAMPGGGR